jgi:CheY-like chemotaxis protein
MIDDNVDVQEVFRRILEYDGFVVTTAHSGGEGLERAARQAFDLIITDLMLPDMPGYQVARTLRSNPQTARIPIAAFTVRSGPDAEQRAREAGCDEVITKPCAIDDFLAHVRRLVSAHPA